MDDNYIGISCSWPNIWFGYVSKFPQTVKPMSTEIYTTPSFLQYNSIHSTISHQFFLFKFSLSKEMNRVCFLSFFTILFLTLHTFSSNLSKPLKRLIYFPLVDIVARSFFKYAMYLVNLCEFLFNYYRVPVYLYS